MFGIHENESKPNCPVSCGIKPLLSEVLDDAESALRKSLASTNLSDLLARILATEKKKARTR